MIEILCRAFEPNGCFYSPTDAFLSWFHFALRLARDFSQVFSRVSSSTFVHENSWTIRRNNSFSWRFDVTATGEKRDRRPRKEIRAIHFQRGSLKLSPGDFATRCSFYCGKFAASNYRVHRTALFLQAVGAVTAHQQRPTTARVITCKIATVYELYLFRILKLLRWSISVVEQRISYHGEGRNIIQLRENESRARFFKSQEAFYEFAHDFHSLLRQLNRNHRGQKSFYLPTHRFFIITHIHCEAWMRWLEWKFIAIIILIIFLGALAESHAAE